MSSSVAPASSAVWTSLTSGHVSWCVSMGVSVSRSERRGDTGV